MLDLNTTLAFEVKKELADRYFGFRRIIEEDSKIYQKKLIASALELEEKIGFDLVRLFVLLKGEDLITEFFKVTGLDEALFYDPYVSNSATIRNRVLATIPVHGLTRKRRFENMFYDIYRELEGHVADYHQRILELLEDRETIKSEIDLFYQKNDIGGIMLFLRGMDGASSGSSGSMAGAIDSDSIITMEEKMRLHPPQSVEKILPILPLIPTAKDIHDKLKTILQASLERQPEFDPKTLR